MAINLPRIPDQLLHKMELIESATEYSQAVGGQWKPPTPKKPSTLEHYPFRGIVLPLSGEDLQYDGGGTFTRDTRKLYTNGKELPVGAEVEDTYDGKVYTVKQELAYGPVHSMKRYAVDIKGVSSPK